MLKNALLIVSLSLSGCASLPPFPDVNQCALRPEALYCVGTTYKERTKFLSGSPEFKDAQCLPVNDSKKSYQAAEAWAQNVKDIAEQHCH